MSDKIFNEPRIALNRIYTRAGDGGETRLVGGQLVPKDDARIDCFGVVDELNACVGLARTTALDLSPQVPALTPFAATLKRVQHELFNLGSILATLPEDVHPKQPRITTAEAQRLEREIDEANESLASLRSFVLPGGSRLDAELHVCRTICRRAERLLVSLARPLAKRAARSADLFEPTERRVFRLEPLGESRPGQARNSLGAQRCGERN